MTLQVQCGWCGAQWVQYDIDDRTPHECSGTLRSRLSAVEAERDEQVAYTAALYQAELELRARAIGAEDRVEALSEALRQIAKRGVKFDAKGTHSAEVCDIARAALAALPERQEGT